MLGVINSFPATDGIFRLSMCSLQYSRRRYYASFERVKNLWIKTQGKKRAEISDKSIAIFIIYETYPHSQVLMENDA